MDELTDQPENNQNETPINSFQDIKAPPNYIDIDEQIVSPKKFNIKNKLKINLHAISIIIVVVLLLVTIGMDIFLMQQNQQLKNNLKSINYKVTTVIPQQISFDCQANAALPQNCR